MLFRSGTSYNYGKWSNSTYDNLVKKAGNEDANNPEKRWNDLVSAAKIVNGNQTITPIYQQTTAYLQNKRVHGIIHDTATTEIYTLSLHDALPILANAFSFHCLTDGGKCLLGVVPAVGRKQLAAEG